MSAFHKDQINRRFLTIIHLQEQFLTDKEPHIFSIHHSAGCAHVYVLSIDSTNVLVANFRPLYWGLWPHW